MGATGPTGASATERRTGWYVPVSNASVVLTGVGLSNPTAAGTGSAQPALTNATRMYVRFAATTFAGTNGPFTTSRPAYRPMLTTYLITDSPLSGSRRIWVGLASASLSGTQPATGPASSSISVVGIAFETGLSSTWRCCSVNGTSLTCADMVGTSLAAGTEYELTVDYSVAGTLTCSIAAGSGSPISVAKTSNLPTAAVDLGVQNLTIALDGASKNHNIGRTVIEQN
jgi:hypothetical protein